MDPLPITAYTATSPIGRGVEANLRALRSEQGGLRPCDFEDADLDTWIGRVDGLEAVQLPSRLSAFDCRNNRLAQLGLETDGFADQVREVLARYGPERVGLFLGTSTAGIRETERLIRDHGDGPPPATYHYRESHNLFSVTDFVGRYLGIEGPRFAISTACSSSAKVFAAAYRHIQAGLCDAAVVGGVDSLCLTTLYGFNALELVSGAPCRPWDRDRNGISIGEAAAFGLVEAEGGQSGGGALLGYGESSDGYHISTPHPEGLGAQAAIREALQRAGLEPGDIGYVNLHGTATPSNDQAEASAISALFPEEPAISSTKGWTGHTLGAAGAVEAVFCLLALEEGFVPGSLNLNEPDPDLGVEPLRHGREGHPGYAVSNSFGFGGSNCSLVFGRLP